MRSLNKAGLSRERFSEIIKEKVYVGVSSGAMITNSDLDLKLSDLIYDKDKIETKSIKVLDLVDFYFLPHLNTPWYSKMKNENIKKLALNIRKRIYALDDESALKLTNNRVEIVTEGEVRVFN